MGEGPAVNVFSAWASTGEADKEKILFKEGLQALKVINASQYYNTNAKTNNTKFFFAIAERQRIQGQVCRLHDRAGENNYGPSCISHYISPVLSTHPRWRQAFLQSAFFFEMPGVTASSSVKRPFEFALVGAGDGLERREDDTVTFRRHFDKSL